MYVRLDLDDAELMQRVIKITGMDYEMLGDFIPVESLLHSIEDLMCEVERLEEKIEDLEQDIEDNYKPVSYAEQVGYSERDFI